MDRRSLADMHDRLSSHDQPPSPTEAPTPLTGSDGRPLFDPLLTVDEVAAWLGKPKATLYAWRTRKQGPRGIRVGSDLRYRRGEVEAWLDAMTEQRRS